MAINRVQLMDELRSEIGKDGDRSIRKYTRRYANRIADEIKAASPSPEHPHPLTKTGPYATGDFVDSIKVERKRERFGLPHYSVVTYSPIAHFLEYGTGDDAPGTHSPWGRFTPTPEFAPFATVVHRHGGTLD